MAALVAFAAQAQDRADRQELTDPDSFTMILLGDPQGYTKYDINQPLFDLCTAWIADNIERLNVRMVLCVGDVVEQNQVLLIIEAMKMENNIDAERGGVVKSIHVQKGATVMEGDLLIVIE